MKIGLISENLKVAWWKNRFCIILNIKQNLNFPTKKCESGFGVGSCKEKKIVPHCKTMTQLNSRYSKTEKDRKIKFKFWCMLRIIHKSFFHRATFKRVENHNEGTQIFDLFFCYIPYSPQL